MRAGVVAAENGDERSISAAWGCVRDRVGVGEDDGQKQTQQCSASNANLPGGRLSSVLASTSRSPCVPRSPRSCRCSWFRQQQPRNSWLSDGSEEVTWHKVQG